MEGILHDQCSVIHLLSGLLNEAASRPCWHMHVNTFHSTHSSCGSNLACWTGTQKVGGHCVHAVECTWHESTDSSTLSGISRSRCAQAYGLSLLASSA